MSEDARNKKGKKTKPKPKRRVYNELCAKLPGAHRVLPKNACMDGHSSDDDQGPNQGDARSKEKHRVTEESVTMNGVQLQTVGAMEELRMKDLRSGPTTPLDGGTRTEPI